MSGRQGGDDGPGRIVIANTFGKPFLRVFVNERLLREFLAQPRQLDDVYILDTPALRIELSVHADSEAAADEVMREIKNIRLNVALARSPAKGAA